MAQKQGIRIRNASGGLVMDSTVRNGRFLGNIPVTFVNGSFTDARIGEGNPWWFVQPGSQATFGNGGNNTQSTVHPTITFTANTVVWTWTGNPAASLRRIDGQYIYGVY